MSHLNIVDFSDWLPCHVIFISQHLIQKLSFKGYLRQKRITSRKVGFKTQFHYVLSSRYSMFMFWTILPIFEDCYVTMSISAGRRVVNHLVMKLGQLIDLVMDNICRKCFAWFGGLGLKTRLLFQYINLLRLIENQVCWVSGFVLFWGFMLNQSKIVITIIIYSSQWR